MTTWEQLLQNDSPQLQTDSPKMGERVINTDSVLFGVSLTSVTFKLSKSSSPSGNVVAGVWNGAGSLIHTFGTIAASSVSTSATDYTFDTTAMSGTLASGDIIGVELTPLGGGTVRLYSQTTDVFDGTNTTNSSWLTYAPYNGAWEEETSNDRYFIFIGAIPPPASSGTHLPPPPITVRF